MNFELVRPCSECPFVMGGVHLTEGRREDIAESLRRDGSFICHKTNEEVGGAGPEQHCAGALIVCEREGFVGQLARIFERLGRYDVSKLAMDDERVPWESLDDWAENQASVVR